VAHVQKSYLSIEKEKKTFEALLHQLNIVNKIEEKELQLDLQPLALSSVGNFSG
jgi:hypothetical protein